MKIEHCLWNVHYFIYGLIFLGSILGTKVSEAATYYVATNGSDSRSCTQAQNSNTPKRTITAALGCRGTARGAGTGHTVEVAAGTYTEELNNIPGGTSWDSPFILRAAAGATVWLKPNTGAARCATFAHANTKYVIFDGISCDAVNVGYDGYKITSGGAGTSDYIRIQNAEIKNAKNQGILVGSTGSEFINLNIHHNGGDRLSHGIYVTGTNNLIERCNIHENAGYGIHVYNSGGGVHNNTLHSNRVWGNGTSGASDPSGIILASGSGNKAYNNIVWNNPNGIQVAYGASGTEVYHNTIYNNTGSSGNCIHIGSGTSNGKIQNNICWKNRAGITNSGTNTLLSNNLMSDPLFVDVTSRNFAVLSSSPAVDEGVKIDAVKDDYAGVSRPKGAAYDIGAYEYAAGQLSVSLPAPTGLVISSD